MATITTICADLPTLYRHLLDLTDTSLHAIRYTHAHTTGVKADSQPERAAYARERLTAEVDTLREIATILADTDHAGSTIQEVATVLAEHATTIAAWPDLLADLERIYARWKTAAAPDTEASDHLCPACGTTTLHWHHNDHLYRCPACDYTGTLEHVTNLRAYVITQANTWISRPLACQLFNLTPSGLRKHIHDGNLNTENGLVHTTQLRALPRRNRV